jgi:formiminotetrahydrofolate cyclodeaminase
MAYQMHMRAIGDPVSSSETIEDYLCRLASGEPTPGCGAAGALHAAQAAALLSMVARFSTGPKFAEHAAEVQDVLERAEELRHIAIALADADEEAFGSVIAAYGLPRGTDNEKAARTRAIQSSLVAAAVPPRELVTVADALVQLGQRLVDFSNPNVISDVAAAAEAARAAAATARVNLEINLSGIKDSDVLSALVAAIETADVVIEEADSLSQRVRKQILR